MNLGLLLVIIGIICAVFVHWTLGLLVFIVGLVLLIAPVMRS